MKIRINLTILFLLGAVFATLLLTLNVHKILALITTDVSGVTPNTYRTYDFFASTTASTVVATSTSATSTNIVAYADSSGRIDTGAFNIAGAKRVDVYLTRGSAFSGYNTGTTTFSIQVTPDGTNWYYFNRLVVSTSTSVSTFSNAFVAASDPNVSIPPNIGQTTPSNNTATSTLHYSMDLTTESFLAMRCIVYMTATSTFANGSSQCQASATF